jgi:hypothetical protein
MERCMFGRHAEKEQIINFLLQTCDSSLSVLPIVGPLEIGKRTLVEHVCKEERVRKQFSQIVHIDSNGMNQLVTDVHGSSELVVSDARSLIVVDLGHDGDDATWRRVHSLICQTYGDRSRVLLISTAEEVSRLGTTQALTMKKLHQFTEMNTGATSRQVRSCQFMDLERSFKMGPLIQRVANADGRRLPESFDATELEGKSAHICFFSWAKEAFLILKDERSFSNLHDHLIELN